MRPGTPGFNGSRLRSAREARGLSGAALAELAERIVGAQLPLVAAGDRNSESPLQELVAARKSWEQEIAGKQLWMPLLPDTATSAGAASSSRRRRRLVHRPEGLGGPNYPNM